MFRTLTVFCQGFCFSFFLTFLLNVFHSMSSVNEFQTLESVSPIFQKKEYEIVINNIYLGSQSRIRDKENVFLRVTLDENNVFDIGRNQHWSIKRGKQILVNQKLKLDPQFVKAGKADFSLELMSDQSIWGLGEAAVSILHCRTKTENLDQGNRFFECAVPGELTPVVSYGLFEKNLPQPDLKIKQIASHLNP
jgi:hypothetical protein